MTLNERDFERCVWCGKTPVGRALAYAPNHYNGPWIYESVCSEDLNRECYADRGAADD